MDSINGLILRRVRVLNEIAFITSDRAHGGPEREGELAHLRQELRDVDARIAAVRIGRAQGESR